MSIVNINQLTKYTQYLTFTGELHNVYFEHQSTHKRHPISHIHRGTTQCLLWVSINSQKTPNISHSQGNYTMSIVSIIQLTKDTQYLTFIGELHNVYCEHQSTHKRHPISHIHRGLLWVSCHVITTLHFSSRLFNLGDVSIFRRHPTSVGIPMLKIRRSHDRLIFNMGIPKPRKDSLYIETGPWSCPIPGQTSSTVSPHVCLTFTSTTWGPFY